MQLRRCFNVQRFSHLNIPSYGLTNMNRATYDLVSQLQNFMLQYRATAAELHGVKLQKIWRSW